MPIGLFGNFPNLETELSKGQGANLIHFQAARMNTGAVWIGRETLNKTTEVGIVHVLNGPGDSFSISSQGAINPFELSNFRVDVENSGEGVYVSIWVR